MADNYLEKKFEQHYAASAVKPRALKPLKQRRVLVACRQEAVTGAVIKSLRVMGHRIIFCHTTQGAEVDTSEANQLALVTGTTYLPLPLDEAWSEAETRLGGIDIAVGICQGEDECGSVAHALSDKMQKQQEAKSFSRVIVVTTDEESEESEEKIRKRIEQEGRRAESDGVKLNGVIVERGARAEDAGRAVRIFAEEENNFLFSQCLVVRKV